MYDIIIIGSGPAGLTSAIYARRAQLSAVVVEKDYMSTGQISVSECVDNYPGLPGISGFDLGEKFRSHAQDLGAEFLQANVTKIERDGNNWRLIFSNGKSQSARTVIYAAGTSYRKLGIPGCEKRRVSYCAVCDGAFYRGKTVAVIGGGDTALGDAIYLSKLVDTVYLVHRRNEFRANKSLQKRISESSNIKPIMNAILSEITGNEKADGIIFTQDSETKRLPVDGIFSAIGSVPNSQLLNGICEMDANGYIIAGEDCITSAPAIFAAGDVRTTPLRQVITAAADGANAAISAERFIEETYCN